MADFRRDRVMQGSHVSDRESKSSSNAPTDRWLDLVDEKGNVT